MTFVFPRNPVKYPFHTFRGLVVQPLFWALMLLSPVFDIFRMDVISQKLIALGQSYPLNPQTLLWLPLGFFSCVLIIAFMSTLFGRLFCGWVCPHNTLTEWTHPVRVLIGLKPKPFYLKQWETKYPWLKAVNVAFSLLWGAAITYMISTLFLFYFVPISWWYQNLIQGTLEPVIWMGQGLMMLIGFFMLYAGHEFCRSACPYGLAQSLSAYLSAKWVPMEIRYKFGENLSACKSCQACKTACPVEIDPRLPENLLVGVGEGCFNCGECIDACTYVRGAQNAEGLLTFKINPNDGRSRTAREVAE